MHLLIIPHINLLRYFYLKAFVFKIKHYICSNKLKNLDMREFIKSTLWTLLVLLICAIGFVALTYLLFETW